MYRGQRQYKLYTWYSHGRTRSFSTMESMLAAYEKLSAQQKQNTDLWREPGKFVPKEWIRMNGRWMPT